MPKQADFELTVLPQVAGLLRVARRLTLDGALADDLVQETLMLAWRGFDRFEPGSNLRAWLFRILMNAHHGNGRKIQRSPSTVPILDGDADWELAHAPASVLAAVDVRQALDRLSVEHRTVLMLGVVEGLSCREMAEVLELPIGTVMSRMSRARQAMRDQLEPTPSSKPQSTSKSQSSNIQPCRAEAL